LERIKVGLNLSAEAAMKDILSAVDGFVGSAHQHDDLTIIVISANK
jgi:serine phosphatase RsbU (regulator of sigma subunit)